MFTVRFGSVSGVDAYRPSLVVDSRRVAGNKFLELREVPGKHPWSFAHRPNTRGAVHMLSIVNHQNAEGEISPHVVLLYTLRLPLGGTYTLELPAGLVGDEDKDETVVEAAKRELEEEAGFAQGRSRASLLLDEWLPTSPGITDERKAFVKIVNDGPRDKKLQKRDIGEEYTIQDVLFVPLDDYMDPARFAQWVAKQKENLIIHQKTQTALDVPAARGLVSGKLDVIG